MATQYWKCWLALVNVSNDHLYSRSGTGRAVPRSPGTLLCASGLLLPPSCLSRKNLLERAGQTWRLLRARAGLSSSLSFVGCFLQKIHNVLTRRKGTYSWAADRQGRRLSILGGWDDLGNLMLERLWRQGNLLPCWWDCELLQPLWKIVQRFLSKLKLECHVIQKSHSWAYIQTKL